MVDVLSYYNDQQWKKFKKHSQKHKTPFLLVDLELIKVNYKQLKENFPFANIYYAMKANPDKNVIKTVKSLGSCFDVASKQQLKQLLKIGVSPQKISYGNTIKKAQDIKYFYKKGVRLFVFDSYNDLINISKYAPNSKVFCRFLFQGGKADWSLSKKFGCSKQMAIELLQKASTINLIPYGVSFHVGSQQRDVTAWKQALNECNDIIGQLKTKGIQLKMINMGGGLPCNYLQKSQNLSYYSENIISYIKEIFGNQKEFQFIMQPGRSLVGNTGVLVSSVIQTANKGIDDKQFWVFVDAGKFNGLIQTLDQAIKYPIYQEKSKKTKKYILAGPTCDSYDIIYKNNLIELSEDTEQGDVLYFLSCGAYTSSYASVCFNGFKPIKTYCI